MYLTEDRMRRRAAVTTAALQKSARGALEEAALEQLSTDESLDVFLSHSSAEPEDILLGGFGTLTDSGLRVYVDKTPSALLSRQRHKRDFRTTA